MSLEQAANAFDAAMGASTTPRQPQGGNVSETVATESMFDGLGELDDDSPVAGGDDLPVKGQRKAKKEEDDDNFERFVNNEEDDEEGHPEGDEEEDGQPDADEEEEDTLNKHRDDLDDVYEVVIDGERREVDLREALDGYIRKETFHQRLNSLNEHREVIREEAMRVIEQRKEYTNKLDQAEKLILALIPQEPDWAAEYRANPDAAAALQKQYNGLMDQVKAIRGAKAAVEDEGKREVDQYSAEYVRQENQKVLNNHPHWKDEEVRTRDLTAMFEMATRMGFSQEEVMGTKDSRMIGVLYKAMKYDRLQANKPKPVRKGGKKPGAPGAGSNRTAPKGLTKASQQLRRTGSVEDAGAVFANIISPRR